MFFNSRGYKYIGTRKRQVSNAVLMTLSLDEISIILSLYAWIQCHEYMFRSQNMPVILTENLLFSAEGTSETCIKEEEDDDDEGDSTTHITLKMTFNPRARPGKEPIKINSVVTNQLGKNCETKTCNESNGTDGVQSARKRSPVALDIANEDSTFSYPCKRNKIHTPNPVNLTNENSSNAMTSHDDELKIRKSSEDMASSSPIGSVAVSHISDHLTSPSTEILPNFSSTYSTVPHAHMAPAHAQRPPFFGTHDPNWSTSLPYPALYHRGGMETITPMTAHCSYTQYQFAQSLHSASSCQFPQNNL